MKTKDVTLSDKEVETLSSHMSGHRKTVRKILEPVTKVYFPEVFEKDNYQEFEKMCELSTKMMTVGHACTLIAEETFDEKEKIISALFGACCFLGDSFLDDFSSEKTIEYIERLERFLTKGWFRADNDREKLFYVIVSRIFAERNIFEPQIRQAVFGQFLAQKKDVLWRINNADLDSLPYNDQIKMLHQCTKDRGGYVILVLSLLLVPKLSLKRQHLLYLAGELFMLIDDHGDFHQDVYNHRITFMNRVDNPIETLKEIFSKNISKIEAGLPDNAGRAILVIFLKRYFLTRLKKNMAEQNRGSAKWVTYE